MDTVVRERVKKGGPQTQNPACRLVGKGLVLVQLVDPPVGEGTRVHIFGYENLL